MKVKDIRIKNSSRIRDLTKQLPATGFQATEVGRGVELIKRMKREKCTIFLSFTANLVASGLRGVIVDFIRKGLVDVVITTGGAIDHDIIRSFRDYELGGFDANDVRLHKRGINRLGNILIPNERYVLLEERVQGILSDIYKRKKTISTKEVITEIAANLRDRNSILNNCYKKNIPVFSPGIIDSAVGLQMFFFKQKHKDFVLDATADMSELFDCVFEAKKTGGVVLGGGISKHHLLGANLLRGGLDYAVVT